MSKFTKEQQAYIEEHITMCDIGLGIQDVRCSIDGDVEGNIWGHVFGYIFGLDFDVSNYKKKKNMKRRRNNESIKICK